jgi:hypothetical protein
LTGGNLILTQGFQQPDTDSTVGVSEPPFLGTIQVYPNPTADIIRVHITSDQRDLKLELSNIIGQTLVSEDIDLGTGSYSGTVNMQGYAAGNYVLCLRRANGHVVTSYKVQKIN